MIRGSIRGPNRTMNGVQDRDRQRAHEEEQAAERRREPERPLRQLGEHVGGTERGDAKRKGEDEPGRDRAIRQYPDVDDRVLRSPKLVRDEAERARDADQHHEADEVVLKQVVLLALGQHVLHRTEC
jgi:hypothetical protein